MYVVISFLLFASSPKLATLFGDLFINTSFYMLSVFSRRYEAFKKL